MSSSHQLSQNEGGAKEPWPWAPLSVERLRLTLCVPVVKSSKCASWCSFCTTGLSLWELDPLPHLKAVNLQTKLKQMRFNWTFFAFNLLIGLFLLLAKDKRMPDAFCDQHIRATRLLYYRLFAIHD